MATKLTKITNNLRGPRGLRARRDWPSAAILAACLAAGCAANPGPARADRPAEARHYSGSRNVQLLRADLDRVFNAPIMAHGVWGIDIRSIDSGERMYERNAGRLMMPASNMKIITTAAAAEILGWDYTFTTVLETAAPIEDGVLKGDLFVRGGGDPSINARSGRAAAVFAEWLTALRAAGIQQIDGRIIGDDQLFDDDGIGPGWAWDYLQYGYAAPVGALEVNENVATLSVSPAAEAGQPATVSLTPGAGLRLMTRVATGQTGSAADINYRRRLDEPILEVSGSIAAQSAAVERTVAVVNPTIFFARALKDYLIERGIGVSGAAVDFDDVAADVAARGGERRILVETKSPPLHEIATVLMKVSQNLYAETLVKAIGAARGSLGTFEGGLSQVRANLTALGVAEDGYVIADGSGLSRYNYLAPSTIATVLERMYKNERHRQAWLATFPIAGKDGSLSTRMRRTRAEGNAVAKTGSIANVRSLSGFVNTRDGETLVFAILANDFMIPAATVNWIADLAVEHLANFTRH